MGKAEERLIGPHGTRRCQPGIKNGPVCVSTGDQKWGRGDSDGTVGPSGRLGKVLDQFDSCAGNLRIKVGEEGGDFFDRITKCLPR